MELTTETPVTIMQTQETRSSEYESAQLGELFTALAKTQSEMQVAKTSSVNPFFKSSYADLAEIVRASRTALTKNGLCVIQRVLREANGPSVLLTRLCHSSGQWIESEIPITPPKPDIQTLGSYITYLRRYNYASIVGVVASGEDDDGEKAMGSRPKQEATVVTSDRINKTQLEILGTELEDQEELLESILTGFKIGKLADLAGKHFNHCMQRIKEIKKAKERTND